MLIQVYKYLNSQELYKTNVLRWARIGIPYRLSDQQVSEATCLLELSRSFIHRRCFHIRRDQLLIIDTRSFHTIILLSTY